MYSIEGFAGIVGCVCQMSFVSTLGLVYLINGTIIKIIFTHATVLLNSSYFCKNNLLL